MGNECFEKFGNERIQHIITLGKLSNVRKENTDLRVAVTEGGAAFDAERKSSEKWRTAYLDADAGKRTWRTIAAVAAVAFGTYVGVTEAR